MISDARGRHVSPGIYTEEKDVVYSVKSLGITSLGLAGETLYGPAFQPIDITEWGEFVDYFGGTDTSVFQENGNPKYELPYVAKSYLEKSKRLSVVRVLGLSGYDAGPAWVLFEKVTDSDIRPVLVLRSKMSYGDDNPEYNMCSSAITSATPIVTCVKKTEYKKIYPLTFCENDTSKAEGTGSVVNSSNVISAKTDTMKFGITVGNCNNGGFEELATYYVSLRKNDTDYIYNVLSSDPEKSDYIYIDALYDVENTETFSALTTTPDKDCNCVDGFFKISGDTSTLYFELEKDKEQYTFYWFNDPDLGCVKTIESTSIDSQNCGLSGHKALSYKIIDKSLEAREGYDYDDISNLSMYTPNKFVPNKNDDPNEYAQYYLTCKSKISELIYGDVYNRTNPEGLLADEKYYIKIPNCRVNTSGDYKKPFRYAQTPWFVSESVFDNNTNAVSVNTLFKFITISDGDAANYQVKVSIEKINPINGTFDVVVRDFNDDDNNPVVLEKFSSCTLTKGDPSYIGFKIGTADGDFVPKSKYILVQFSNNGSNISGHIPCGFLGYETFKYIPTEKQGDEKLFKTTTIKYNTEYDIEKRSKVQYFGMNKGKFSYDILKYHGQDPETTIYTDGFHMESIVGTNRVESKTVYVDGISGYTFQSVSDEKVDTSSKAPVLTKHFDGSNYIIKDTIYKDEKLRKFTVYFYGGFDGWDINRGMRTNTDTYNASKYRVQANDFFANVNEKSELKDLNLPSTAITTDYYAYMAGYRCFANPSDIDINVFATPGIDWKNNKMLTSDVIDMIEDKDDGRGGDCLYVMNCPNGEEIDELVSDFEDSEIDTSYACTYYPWIVYFDNTQSQYIKLPVTKDVVRNMADTDNVSFPWYAPAGFNRGNVDCVMADFKTTLSQEDDLYSNMINPVKTFGVDGVKIWGNKTAYSIESPLNRVNVRRLMIRVKKLVTSAARNLIFEQYSDTLEKQFRGLVEPILAEVKSNRGITDYRVLTEVTPETRDQHILPAKILIKPTPALEYISISFVVYPESVDFMDE